MPEPPPWDAQAAPFQCASRLEGKPEPPPSKRTVVVVRFASCPLVMRKPPTRDAQADLMGCASCPQSMRKPPLWYARAAPTMYSSSSIGMRKLPSSGSQAAQKRCPSRPHGMRKLSPSGSQAAQKGDTSRPRHTPFGSVSSNSAIAESRLFPHRGKKNSINKSLVAVKNVPSLNLPAFSQTSVREKPTSILFVVRSSRVFLKRREREKCPVCVEREKKARERERESSSSLSRKRESSLQHSLRNASALLRLCCCLRSQQQKLLFAQPVAPIWATKREKRYSQHKQLHPFSSGCSLRSQTMCSLRSAHGSPLNKRVLAARLCSFGMQVELLSAAPHAFIILLTLRFPAGSGRILSYGSAPLHLSSLSLVRKPSRAAPYLVRRLLRKLCCPAPWSVRRGFAPKIASRQNNNNTQAIQNAFAFLNAGSYSNLQVFSRSSPALEFWKLFYPRNLFSKYIPC